MRPLVLKGHTKPIKDLHFNKDNDLLFSASTDRFITLWSSEYGERIGTYQHMAAVYTMSIDKDTKYISSGDSTGCVYFWEACNGNLLKKLIIPKGVLISCVNFDSKGENISIAYGGRKAEDKSYIDIYKFKDILGASVKDDKEIDKKLPCEKIELPKCDKVTKTKWCDLDSTIICGSQNGNLYKYEVKKGKLLIHQKIHDETITDLDLSKEEELILTASKDGKAKVINPDNFEVLSELHPDSPTRNINSCVFSPLIGEEDESLAKYHAFIAGGQESKDVTTTHAKKGGFEMLIYDCMYGVELGAILGHFGPVNALAITSDGELLASGSEESSVRVHRIMNEEYKDLIRQ